MSQIDGNASQGLRSRVRPLHRGLLHLHKSLLNVERSNYESVHGKVSAGQLLQLVINDRQFTWLRAVSELIVRLDELEEADDPPASDEDFQALFDQLKMLLNPSDHATEFGQKYDAALKKDSTAMKAHEEVRGILDTK